MCGARDIITSSSKYPYIVSKTQPPQVLNYSLTDLCCISLETIRIVHRCTKTVRIALVQCKGKRTQIQLLFCDQNPLFDRIFLSFKDVLWLISYCHANFHERNTQKTCTLSKITTVMSSYAHIGLLTTDQSCALLNFKEKKKKGKEISCRCIDRCSAMRVWLLGSVIISK
jgi:hypothetical protein